jgi:hypothetical protein
MRIWLAKVHPASPRGLWIGRTGLHGDWTGERGDRELVGRVLARRPTNHYSTEHRVSTHCIFLAMEDGDSHVGGIDAYSTRRRGEACGKCANVAEVAYPGECFVCDALEL